MPQKLILPLNKVLVNWGYKNPAYPKSFHGFTHYGVDYVGERSIWGSGYGEVVAAGSDSTFGNSVVIIYPDVYNHKTRKTSSLVARYFHLEHICVKRGDKVSVSSKIGLTGTTGLYSSGIHLHIEFDCDTKFPMYVPGIKRSSMFYPGTDTTVNPSYVFHICKTDSQTIKPGYPPGIYPQDYKLPLSV